MTHADETGSIRARVAPVTRAARSGLILALLGSVACPPPELPTDLGECPDESSVTWSDAGPIFASNCTGCHSSALVTAEERSDATVGFDFDSAAAAASSPWLTWSQISSGRMPKSGEFSSDSDALIVWEWLSCDGPP